MTSSCGIDKHRKPRKQKELFHPFEMAFCGYSGSGKTTLISKLISHFSTARTIGYIKHDAHTFDIDHPGKDTHNARSAGSSQVFINSSDSFGMHGSSDIFNVYDQRTALAQNDWVFIEGYKDSHCTKIVVIDSEGLIIEKLENDTLSHCAAIIYPHTMVSFQNTSLHNIPQFSRDDIDTIALFIEEHFTAQVQEVPINGIILSGGQSTRMKKDKAQLTYYGVPHQEYLYKLIEPLCDQAFISIASDHTSDTRNKLPLLIDTYTQMGPLGGILTALRAFPEHAILVVACDLPFLNIDIIKTLIAHRDPFKFATVYMNEESDFPEPLCALYEPKFYRRALQFSGMGFNCPRKVLINSAIKKLSLTDNTALFNSNTPEDYHTALNKIKELQ